MDAYLFSNPISYVVLSVTIFFLLFDKAYDQELQNEVELIVDDG